MIDMLGYLYDWGSSQDSRSRFMKRQLSKARRRSWRDPHQRGLTHWEGECNWKGH